MRCFSPGPQLTEHGVHGFHGNNAVGFEPEIKNLTRHNSVVKGAFGLLVVYGMGVPTSVFRVTKHHFVSVNVEGDFPFVDLFICCYKYVATK